MRCGSVWKRCTKCGTRVREKRCLKCGSDSFTWSYKVDVSIPGQPRKQFKKGGFATKAAATAAMNTLQVERVEGTYVEPSKMTVGQYLGRWVAAGCGGVRPWTLRGYASVVGNHIVPRIGHLHLQALTRADIKAMYAELRAGGYTERLTAEQRDQLVEVARRFQTAQAHGSRLPVRVMARELDRPEATVRHWVRRCRELGLLGNSEPSAVKPQPRGLSPKSVHNVHIALRAALNDAVEDGLLRANPATGALRPPKGGPEMRTWVREQLATFLDAVKSERELAIFRLAAYSGMRRGELLGLRWADARDVPSAVAEVRVGAATWPALTNRGQPGCGLWR